MNDKELILKLKGYIYDIIATCEDMGIEIGEVEEVKNKMKQIKEK